MSRLGIVFLLVASGVIGGFVILATNTSKSIGTVTVAPGTPQEPVEASFYEKLQDESTRCELCFRGCVIPEGERGFCRNRENRDGTLYTLVYNMPCALQVDPIEKEPMYHILPGTFIFCVGTASCNYRCLHCQNWHMSQRSLEELQNYYVTPTQIVDMAVEYGCRTVSFTYNEPTVFFEYMYDIVILAKERGLFAIFHTNGSLNPEPLRHILEYVDGVTVDLKGFTEEFYRDVSSAELDHVLNTLKIIKEEGVWLEVVYLVIPTLNDDPEEIRQMCEWILEYLGSDTPLHFSRFFPAYRLTRLHPTPLETIEQAYEIAREAGLEYVTIGNVPGHKYNSTFCPACGEQLIARTHFEVLLNNIDDGRCGYCGEEIPGIWE